MLLNTALESGITLLDPCSLDKHFQRTNSGKLSARNVLPGTVRKSKRGAVNAELAIEVAPGITVIAVITVD
jgi:ABC-type molybdate transport system ATPase subunit